ncbi:HAD-IA family hydrolase [Aurantiacibacter gilvus]|uniref:phosphoglycolate phosphatase n=1 Tax=Aurantiacibacter gilvus TaxID=3139141 RepID=A0ABU9IBE7_9SPHN
MATFPFDIVLFDLDGTLVDSSLDLCPALNHALVMEGRPSQSPAQVRQLIGGGAMAMLERGLNITGGPVSEERFEELSDALLQHYWAHIADNTVPFDGVLGALDELDDRGVKLAVCTNKSEGPTKQLLDELDLTRRFTAIYGGDSLGREKAKPKPDMLLGAIRDCGGGSAVMVGDSTFDVNAARNAGIPAIAYRYGYHDVPVAELGADAVIDHFNQLVGTLESL